MKIREVRKEILNITPQSTISNLDRNIKESYVGLKIAWGFMTTLIFGLFIYLFSLVDKKELIFYVLCCISLSILGALLFYIGKKKGVFGVVFEVKRISLKIVEVELTDFNTIWYGYKINENSDELFKFVIKRSNFYPKKEFDKDFFTKELYLVTYYNPFIKTEMYVYEEI